MVKTSFFFSYQKLKCFVSKIIEIPEGTSTEETQKKNWKIFLHVTFQIRGDLNEFFLVKVLSIVSQQIFIEKIKIAPLGTSSIAAKKSREKMPKK